MLSSFLPIVIGGHVRSCGHGVCHEMAAWDVIYRCAYVYIHPTFLREPPEKERSEHVTAVCVLPLFPPVPPDRLAGSGGKLPLPPGIGGRLFYHVLSRGFSASPPAVTY